MNQAQETPATSALISQDKHASQVALRVSRFLARAASLVSIAILGMFIFGGTERTPVGGEWISLAAFPFGVGLGMVLAWRHEILGGALCTASIIITYATFLMRSEPQWPGIWFLIFATPGIALLIVGMLSRRLAR